MRAKQGRLTVKVLALAVQGAIVAMAAVPMMAMADDDEVAALTNPNNYVEFGVTNVSKNSQKFGEYNGLYKKGTDALINFSVKGGDAYGQRLGTTRWSVTGADLGTTSRELGAGYADQGKWSIGVQHDELRHNTTTNYQTPYQGSVGGDTFILPAGFGTVANTIGTTPGSTVMTAAQVAALQKMDVYNKRTNNGINAAVTLNPQWQVTFDFNRLDQSGAKLMAFGSAGYGGAGGEKISILPNPTNYKTDTVTLALNWTGENGHATGAYHGSFFRDDINQLKFQTWNGANTLQTMSTAPDNDYHQLNFTGGYAFSPQTKFAGGLSYSRNTQNKAYMSFAGYADAGLLIAGYPTQSSLDGKVVNTHADGKVTHQATKDLTLSAALKYDRRANKTSSSIYGFDAIDAAVNHNAFYANTPLSNKKTQLEVAADYRIGKDRFVRVAYNRENVDRWCESYAGNGTKLTNPNNTIGTIYGAGGNCVTATGSKEDKLGATYRFKPTDDATANLGYTYAKRAATFDSNAVAAFITDRTGPSDIAGQNAADWFGFNPWFEASRTEQVLKGGVNWQANERLSFGATGRYTDDKYSATYGVQNGNLASLNLDSTYAYGDEGSISAYLTQQHREREMDNTSGITPITTGTFINNLKDDDTTIGLGFKQGGLLGSKLELAGDLTYSLARTTYETHLNYSPATACTATTSLTCGALPAIRSALTQFKLTGTYSIDKASKVMVGYLYQRLNSDDFYYNGLQLGYTPRGVMPTNQQSGSYSVNVVSASYIYSFK